jgi:acyl-coenzyme A thioesterase PaaI-like protein
LYCTEPRVIAQRLQQRSSQVVDVPVALLRSQYATLDMLPCSSNMRRGPVVDARWPDVTHVNVRHNSVQRIVDMVIIKYCTGVSYAPLPSTYGKSTEPGALTGDDPFEALVGSLLVRTDEDDEQSKASISSSSSSSSSVATNEAVLFVRPQHCNSYGILHGGMQCTLADFALCLAAMHDQHVRLSATAAAAAASASAPTPESKQLMQQQQQPSKPTPQQMVFTVGLNCNFLSKATSGSFVFTSSRVTRQSRRSGGLVFAQGRLFCKKSVMRIQRHGTRSSRSSNRSIWTLGVDLQRVLCAPPTKKQKSTASTTTVLTFSGVVKRVDAAVAPSRISKL